MEIVSTAFENGNSMPVKYAKKGDNIPPPLKFENVPENTKSLALIVDDPGGPLITFVHWVVWNIPPNIAEISKGANITYPQGKNSFRKQGYLGPCPPHGKHNYFFKLYALDVMLDLNQGATKKKIVKAMSGHIIAEAQLMGTFQK